MEKIGALKEGFSNAYELVTGKIALYIPNIIGALIVFIAGLLFLSIIFRIVKFALKKLRVNTLSDKLRIKEYLSKIGIKSELNVIIAKFIYWFLFLILLIGITDIFKLHFLSNSLNLILVYIPKIFTAFLIFLIGVIITNIIKRRVTTFFEGIGIQYGTLLVSLLNFIIIFSFTVTALEQLDIQLELVKRIFIILFVILFLSVFACFIWGAKDMFASFIVGFYLRSNLKKELNIEYSGNKFQISELGAFFIKLRDEKDNELLLLYNKLLNNFKIAKD